MHDNLLFPGSYIIVAVRIGRSEYGYGGDEEAF